METRQKVRHGNMEIKLEISKTYVQLEWSFLKAMMRNLGFHELWISKIMTCMTTASYATLVNGQPGLVIVPSRDLRQGDPISSYLYLICAKGLSMLLNKSEKSSRITRVKVARENLTINHLFFANDSIIFYGAKRAGNYSTVGFL